MKVKKRTFFKRAEFFLAGMRTQWDEGGRRILLGDYISGGAGMVRPVDSSVSEFGFQLDSTVAYMTMSALMYTQFQLTQNSTYIGPTGR